jgi:hypothetical protein
MWALVARFAPVPKRSTKARSDDRVNFFVPAS